ncbi:MAG: 50S ribosomal protein L10 [Bacteroidales bacterium]
MRKEDKGAMVELIASTIKEYSHFYIADTTGLNAAKTSDFRRACFKADVKLLVVKNTMLKKALESLDTDFSPLYGALKGTSAMLFSNVGNEPAKLIKTFRNKGEIPALKGAYVEESFYGADQLNTLCAIKSKNELIADVVSLLQSPMRNIISALVAKAEKEGESAAAE